MLGNGLPILCDEVPIYEARGDIMFIKWNGLEIAIPISVCKQCVARCNRELDRWHEARGLSVVRFPAGPH